MFVFHGKGYENTELILNGLMTDMGGYVTCEMMSNPAKCLNALQHLNASSLLSSVWAIGLLDENRTKRIAKLRKEAELFTECANYGSLVINAEDAVFTISDYSCVGEKINESARLVLRKGTKEFFAISVNSLFPT